MTLSRIHKSNTGPILEFLQKTLSSCKKILNIQIYGKDPSLFLRTNLIFVKKYRDSSFYLNTSFEYHDGVQQRFYDSESYQLEKAFGDAQKEKDPG